MTVLLYRGLHQERRPEEGRPEEGQPEKVLRQDSDPSTDPNDMMNLTHTITATADANLAERWAPVDSAVDQRKIISVCDTQPVTAEGIHTLLDGCRDLRYGESTDSLSQAADSLRHSPPAVLLLDKAFGMQLILDWLSTLRGGGPVDLTTRTAVVIWGASVTEAEALRFLQAGARGILRKTAGIPTVLACLRTVAGGRSWMEDSVFRDSARGERYPHSELTAREQQVLGLVEQGFKNKEIAVDLGIRPGTVKIHLKHIFEKTGVRGRYGLALNGLRERGMSSAQA
jgi:DNA-binding NarL/FixJ family response regulator